MNAQKSHDILLEKFDKISGNYLYQNADKIDYEQALWDGAEALEKQIPKKIDKKSLTLVRATNEKLESHLYEAYPCPTCKDWVQKNYKCCQWCGQALDWSDIE